MYRATHDDYVFGRGRTRAKSVTFLKFNMQRYRRGHNGADSKSVCAKSTRGFESLPLRQEKPKSNIMFGLGFLFCLFCAGRVIVSSEQAGLPETSQASFGGYQATPLVSRQAHVLHSHPLHNVIGLLFLWILLLLHDTKWITIRKVELITLRLVY